MPFPLAGVKLAYPGHWAQIVVEEIAHSQEDAWSRGGVPPATAPKLLLEGLPAEVSASAVMWALQAQDVNVTEAMIHLAHNGGDKPYVELNSVAEQQDLLELGSLTIKKTPVPLRAKVCLMPRLERNGERNPLNRCGS
jgi:hypothetical protein